MSNLTAADLREYFRADAKRMNRLSPEAQKTVQPGARGRVSPEAIKVHNRYRKGKYEVGNSTEATKAAKEQSKAFRAQHGLGQRGPLPKALRG